MILHGLKPWATLICISKTGTNFCCPTLLIDVPQGLYVTSIGRRGRLHRMIKNHTEIVILTPSSRALPALVAATGPKASRRFVEFFTANIRNKNTREAYRRTSLLS
jgi:hypothetical protein